MNSTLKRLFNWRFPIYIIRSFEKFYRDLGSFHAATLTFYTLFALVPFLGLMFGIAQSFGFEQKLKDVLKELLAGQDEIYQNLLVFTNNVLSQTKEQWIAGVGLIFLVWSVYKVLRVLDQIFNQIWSIRIKKNSLMRAQQFASLLLLSPIVLIILGGVIVEVLNTAQTYLPTEYIPLPSQLLITQANVVLIILFTLLFGLSYWGLPAIRIPILPALGAGFIASLLFYGLQSVYVGFQSTLIQYGVVYGSFASVPLFMMWVYFSWVIYLLGAELTYIFESRITQSWELQLNSLPIRLQRALAIEIVNVIKERFQKGEPALNASQISKQLTISKALTRKILGLLMDADLITVTSPTTSSAVCYVPKKDVNWLSNDFVVEALEQTALSGTTVSNQKVQTLIDDIEKRNQ